MTGRQKMRGHGRARVVGVAFAVAASGLGWSASSAGAAPTAHAAGSHNIVENATLQLVRKSGSRLYERGSGTGSLPGTVTAQFDVTLTKVTGSVTIYPRDGGSLTINVLGYPQSTGINARFAGNMAVRRGTGRYSRAVGSGTFSGVVNRRTWAVSVHANARLTY
jgi:hypothetical protein